jgi:glutaredoxin-related protein
MNKHVFFGNDMCPYCRRALVALRQGNVDFEYVEIPMQSALRGPFIYQGQLLQFSGQTFEMIFDGNVSIPKFITVSGKKLHSSDQIIEFAR